MSARGALATIAGAAGVAAPALLAAGGRRPARRRVAGRSGRRGGPRDRGRHLALAALAGRGRGLFACAGLLAPVALLAVAAPLAGPRALSGRPRRAGPRRRRPRPRGSGWRPRGLFLPLVFLVLVVMAGRTRARVGPEGDEPHYLMVAESLRRDGDLSLERDYAEGRYAAFHDAPLAPHYRVRAGRGRLLAARRGLSVLVLPRGPSAGWRP